MAVTSVVVTLQQAGSLEMLMSEAVQRPEEQAPTNSAKVRY